MQITGSQNSYRICFFLFIIMAATTTLLAPEDSYFNFDELVQGMLMRDSMIKSLTLDYSTRSSFLNGNSNVLPTDYSFVYRDDKVYMETQHKEENVQYLSKAAFDEKTFKFMDMNNQNASIGTPPPWSNQTKLRTF